MKIGVVFPQNDIGSDPAVIRDYAQAAEGAGYSQLLAYDHILGAGLANRPDWKGVYSEKDPFHEIFILFAYLAAFTKSIDFVSGVLVLPIRQTALVAKQAATLDLFSGGRLRVGVGVGWNAVEAEAMGADFHARGKHIEEQIEVLRKLWTEPVVSFKGQYSWDTIPEAGLNPMPVQQPIPIWIGGYSDAVLHRAARLGDGYFPASQPPDKIRPTLDKLRQYLGAEGRNPDAFGIEARVRLRDGDSDTMRGYIEQWRDMGVSHLDIDTMGLNLTGAQHISSITRAWDELGLADFAG